MFKFSHPEDEKKKMGQTQGMCKNAIEQASCVLEYVPDHLKTQEICEKAVKDKPETLNLFQITSRLKGCVKRPLKMKYIA